MLLRTYICIILTHHMKKMQNNNIHNITIFHICLRRIYKFPCFIIFVAAKQKKADLGILNGHLNKIIHIIMGLLLDSTDSSMGWYLSVRVKITRGRRTEEAKSDDEDERDGEVDKHGRFRVRHRQGSRHGFSDYSKHAHFSRFLSPLSSDFHFFLFSSFMQM